MTAQERLFEVLGTLGPVAVAVSGGIDSLTLATAAHRVLGGAASMHHATSPAVPGEATERTRALAAAQGWSLDVFDAGEFDDASYRANPVNRCFFCKTNLYGAVARRTTRTILSGTNLDDLGDYRPGLQAAREHAVRHPLVEAGIDKRGVRALAAALGLGGLAELPSAPCLSSRIETGLRIEPEVLAMVHAAETLVAGALARQASRAGGPGAALPGAVAPEAGTLGTAASGTGMGPAVEGGMGMARAREPRSVRCRVRAGGVVIELDRDSLDGLDPERAEGLREAVAGLAGSVGLAGPVRLAAYRTGSAFLHVAPGAAEAPGAAAAGSAAVAGYVAVAGAPGVSGRPAGAAGVGDAGASAAGVSSVGISAAGASVVGAGA